MLPSAMPISARHAPIAFLIAHVPDLLDGIKKSVMSSVLSALFAEPDVARALFAIP